MLIEQRITDNGIETIDKVQIAINRIIGFKVIALPKDTGQITFEYYMEEIDNE